MTDVYNLHRFLTAQAHTYHTVFIELQTREGSDLVSCTHTFCIHAVTDHSRLLVSLLDAQEESRVSGLAIKHYQA